MEPSKQWSEHAWTSPSTLLGPTYRKEEKGQCWPQANLQCSSQGASGAGRDRLAGGTQSFLSDAKALYCSAVTLCRSTFIYHNTHTVCVSSENSPCVDYYLIFLKIKKKPTYLTNQGGIAKEAIYLRVTTCCRLINYLFYSTILNNSKMCILQNPPYEYKNSTFGGWRDSSVVKSTGCSSSEDKIDSQCLHGGSQPSGTPVWGAPTPVKASSSDSKALSWPLRALHACGAHTYVHSYTLNRHKNFINS